MERDLSINLLEKPRLEKNRKFSYRYVIYGLIFIFLLPMYTRSFFARSSNLKKSTVTAMTNTENLKRKQIERQWDLLLNFLNLLARDLPENATIMQISGEQNLIRLQGKINNNVSLNNFIDLLSKNLKNGRISLGELNQKNGLEFTILISNKQDFLLAPEDSLPPPKALIRQLIQNAEHSFLQINSIKPEENGLRWQLTGSYAAIMYFFSRLKKNNFVLDHFQIKPAGNQLEFEGKLKVVQI